MYNVEFNDEEGFFEISIVKDGKSFYFPLLTLIDLSIDPDLDLEQSNIEKLNTNTQFVLYEDVEDDPFSARFVYAQYTTDSYDEAVELAKKDINSYEMQLQLVNNYEKYCAKIISEMIEEFRQKMQVFHDEIPSVASALNNQCIDGQK